MLNVRCVRGAEFWGVGLLFLLWLLGLAEKKSRYVERWVLIRRRGVWEVQR